MRKGCRSPTCVSPSATTTRARRSPSRTPTRIGGSASYLGFTDPSTPAGATLLGIHSDGSTPVIGGTHHLPGHGEFGAGRAWQEFSIGDFTAADSQLGDFIHTFPPPGGGVVAQIHAYDVHVEGADAHFDLYAQIEDAHPAVPPAGRFAKERPRLAVIRG